MIGTPAPDVKPAGSTYGLGGLPRKRSGNFNSLRGKAGNPTQREFRSMLEGLFKKPADPDAP